jgi:hypothetical protein
VKSWANRAPLRRVVTEKAALPAIRRSLSMSKKFPYKYVLMFVGKLHPLPQNAVTNKFRKQSRPEACRSKGFFLIKSG